MATLFITEFSRVILDSQGREIMAPDLDSLTAEQQMAITGGSTQSDPLNSATKFILLANDATIYSLAYGANPTAVVTAHRVNANEVRFYGASGGKKIAVISNT